MKIREILKDLKLIWGKENKNLGEIIVRMGVVFGDICRWERNSVKDKINHTEYELKKEFGNIILSGIKWADELGFDPEECIKMALKAQQNKIEELKSPLVY